MSRFKRVATPYPKLLISVGDIRKSGKKGVPKLIENGMMKLLRDRTGDFPELETNIIISIRLLENPHTKNDIEVSVAFNPDVSSENSGLQIKKDRLISVVQDFCEELLGDSTISEDHCPGSNTQKILLEYNQYDLINAINRMCFDQRCQSRTTLSL